MQVLKGSALYFAVVFSAGFALGTARVLSLVPRFGTRVAELMEAPIMLIVTVLAARWAARRFSLPPTPAIRLSIGFVALGFMLFAEFTLVLWFRGITIGDYIKSRDPVAGTVYLVMLGLFTVIPLLVARR
jgi:hypothetical protein